MKKLSEAKISLVIVCVLIFLAIITSVLWNVKFPFDYYSSYYGELRFGSLHVTFNIIIITLIVIIIAWCAVDFDSIYTYYKNHFYNAKNENENEPKNKFTLKKLIYIGISIFMLFQIFNLLKDIYSDSKNIFNSNKIYENIYTQKIQERELFYDKMWKTYIQKSKIADLNKDIFINVTKLIMENRSDGKNLLWKWNQENQAVPYNEFTKFYEELSLYVQEQREEYFKIEKECQSIVNKNNIMLDTFPNNFYNKILKIKHMEFKYGFTSDSTNNVFQNKIENLN